MGGTAHLTDDQRKSIGDKCAIMQQFYMELQSEMDTKPRHEDISKTLSQIENKQMLIESEVNSILSTPVPAPVKIDLENRGAAEDAAPGEGEANLDLAADLDEAVADAA